MWLLIVHLIDVCDEMGNRYRYSGRPHAASIGSGGAVPTSQIFVDKTDCLYFFFIKIPKIQLTFRTRRI